MGRGVVPGAGCHSSSETDRTPSPRRTQHPATGCSSASQASEETEAGRTATDPLISTPAGASAATHGKSHRRKSASSGDFPEHDYKRERTVVLSDTK